MLSWSFRPVVGFVALRKESVDRNDKMNIDAVPYYVALRKESVDRNRPPPQVKPIRGAVALRKESVDRNNGIPYSAAIRRASLSARRAWIEMLNPCEICQGLSGRSPQGERG